MGMGTGKGKQNKEWIGFTEYISETCVGLGDTKITAEKFRSRRKEKEQLCWQIMMTAMRESFCFVCFSALLVFS